MLTALKGRTHGCTDQACDLKILLANLEPSTLASALGHLGRLDEVRQIWRGLKEINPRYSYVDHFGRLPFKTPTDADKFTDGLRKAGLAE